MSLSAADFAKRLYAAEGAAEDCLLLQDAAGVDVPIALFSLFLAQRGAALDSAAAAAAASERWAAHWVRPMRALRRAMKPEIAWAAEAGLPAEDIREAVKALELRAELAQLALLQRLCAPPPPSADAASHRPTCAAARAAAAESAFAALCPAAAPTVLARPELNAAWTRLIARAEALQETNAS